MPKPNLQAEPDSEYFLNVKTNRYVLKTGSVYKKLYKQGVITSSAPASKSKLGTRPDVSLRMQNFHRTKKGLEPLTELPEKWKPKRIPQKLQVDNEPNALRYKKPVKVENDFNKKDAKLNAICLDIINKNKAKFDGLNALESSLELKQLLKARLKNRVKKPVNSRIPPRNKKILEENNDDGTSGFPDTDQTETCTDKPNESEFFSDDSD